ncbi:hypothetical protein ACA29_12890 [Lederbergia galactosidilytica]|uniref:Uncharacterized protein n=1 Tax=Lederbergia galactosidilytica TaxID=217031 RepID=A0A0Q9XTM4_9BACI|nr:hypothetical protein ACA29_12890 [Lederbergia galactosidilytica]
MVDKNTKALFQNIPADPPEIKSTWDQYVLFDLEEYSESGIDIQEFLRVTAEEAEIRIEEAKGK